MYEETAAPQPQVRLPPPGPTDRAELTEPVSRGWTARFTLVWLGFWAAQFVPVQLILPDELDRIDHADKIRDFGLITGVGAVVALVTLPLCGALCDRTHSRWGRRRVWVAGGIAATATGLLLMSAQNTPLGLGLVWLGVTFGISAATAGLSAAVADHVPERQKGMVSGAMYAPQPVGVVGGIAVITVFGLTATASYGVLATTLVLCAVPFVLRYQDTAPAASAQVTAPVTPRARKAAGGQRVTRSADFRWVLATRLLVNLTNSLGVCYLLYFLSDAVRVTDPAGSLLQLTLIYVTGVLITSLVGGTLSDRLGRRRIFVSTAAVLQCGAALALALAPTLEVATSAAAVFGAGLGTYMSVDQALVTAVLPNAEFHARDLGIMNAASLVPQAFAPLVAGLIITALGSYSALYGIAAATAALAGIVVLRVRAVR